MRKVESFGDWYDERPFEWVDGICQCGEVERDYMRATCLLKRRNCITADSESRRTISMNIFLMSAVVPVCGRLTYRRWRLG